mmetsp:Transcript_23900/g.42419  ORF Transcript_23900/g.42419 Transcript_23900/m.42419 type:complete len:274 (-) Transcript_23900:364-1185(-)
MALHSSTVEDSPWFQKASVKVQLFPWSYHCSTLLMKNYLKVFERSKCKSMVTIMKLKNRRHRSLMLRLKKKKSDEPPIFHILVVDDILLNRKLLCRMLKNKGHTCDEAENGLAAVKLVEAGLENSSPYDMVLMDYEMPVLNGPGAASKIRELGCNTFIIGITGNLLPEDVIYFEKNGANCVLPKPLNMVDLEAKWKEFGVRPCKSSKSSSVPIGEPSTAGKKSEDDHVVHSPHTNRSAYDRDEAATTSSSASSGEATDHSLDDFGHHGSPMNE